MCIEISLGKEKSPWTIREVAGLDSALLVKDMRCRGTTHYYSREIFIDKDMSFYDKKQTLIHELTHATLYDTQIESKESYSEEDICEFMGIYGESILKIAENYLEEKRKTYENDSKENQFSV